MNMTDVLKFTRSQQFDVTLSAGGWSGSAAPFSYTINSPMITDFNNVEVVTHPNTNIDQYKALAKAAIISGTQSNGRIVLKAMGKKPTISIPLTIIVRGGMV